MISQNLQDIPAWNVPCKQAKHSYNWADTMQFGSLVDATGINAFVIGFSGYLNK